MTNTAELQSELIINPKCHPKGAVKQPGKPKQRRYERRMAKAYLRTGTWLGGEIPIY
jgi:hypothetical protein